MIIIFITFEGIDGSGKSTVIEKLKQKYPNQFLFLREPGGTNISEELRNILLKERDEEVSNIAEMLIYAASRQQLNEEIIKPTLKQGKNIICDRYVDSSIAYQGVNVDKDFITTINQFSEKPDLTFYFKISVEEAMNRMNARNEKDRLENKSESYFNNVIGNYNDLIKQDENRFIVVDGSKTKDQVFDFVEKELKEKGLI